MENYGLNMTGYGREDSTTSMPAATTSTQSSLNKIRLFNVPLALVLSLVILIYLLLVLLAVCILSKVCRHVATADLYGLCGDLGMTCRQCCSCSCRCSCGYTCMQYAVDECLLVCRDCQYTCAHCRQICQDTNITHCFRFLIPDNQSSLILLLQQLLPPPVFLQSPCYR